MGDALSVAPKGRAVPTGRNVARSPNDATLPKDPNGATAVPRGPTVAAEPNWLIKAAAVAALGVISAVAPPFGPTFFMTNSVDGFAF